MSQATHVSGSEKMYDLTFKFAHVKENIVADIAKARWTSSTVNRDKHPIDHDTF